MQATEEEQTRLAAEEDFEKAEALNDVIQSSAAEVRAREVVLADLRTSVRMLEETFAHERADCVSNFLRAANSLRATREQLVVALTQQQSSVERQWDLEDSRIRAELERISLEKGHFEREEQALSGDSERTEEAIRTQTGDLSDKKKELESSMEAVSEEIRILQEQLALKVSAQQLLAADLDRVDGKIGEVRKKYDRQLQRIADRQIALQSSKAECLEEESAVLREQQVLETQAAEASKIKLTAAAWATSLETDLQISDVMLSKLKAATGGLEGYSMASLCSVDAAVEGAATVELRRNLEAISYLLHKKRVLLAELQLQRDKLVVESRRLADLLPVYEAEKKAHASAKRFKEAAAVAKELKEVLAAKETIERDVDELDASASATTADIDQLVDQETVTSKALRDAHRQGDIARFENLLVQAAEVRVMQRLVASKRKDPESGDSEDIGNGVLTFLSTELEALQKEAAVLKDLHSLPQDVFANENADDSLSESESGALEDFSGTQSTCAVQVTAAENVEATSRAEYSVNETEVPHELSAPEIIEADDDGNAMELNSARDVEQGSVVDHPTAAEEISAAETATVRRNALMLLAKVSNST